MSADEVITAINKRFGSHPHHRALHAKGTVCEATFTAAPMAAKLTRAAHMSGTPVPATVRVSNGGGDPTVPDYLPDLRGFAVSFQLPGGGRTVISANTSPVLPVDSARAFVELMSALEPQPSALWRLPVFLAKHPRTVPRLPSNARATRLPASYATISYYGAHAFKWVAADGSSRFVRYRWRPEAGEQHLGRAAAKRGGPDYLREELAARLATEPVRFTLLAQVAAEGDDPSDPMGEWPASRPLIPVGTLEITAITEESGVLVFDPTAVTDGIELSDDPILRFRAAAYTVSVDKRLA